MEADKFYHVYNRTNNKELLFKDEENYKYFLRQFQKYISPVVHLYAYCLIPNHFHFVLRIKSDHELREFLKDKIEKSSKVQFFKGKESDLQGFRNLGGLSKLISQQFSNFFNSYTKAINKRYNRNGSLFSPNFKRKEITTQRYLTQVIIYVHLNPENHGLVDQFIDYTHSSYHSILTNKKSLIERKEVIELFGDEANFEMVHKKRTIDENAFSFIDE